MNEREERQKYSQLNTQSNDLFFCVMLFIVSIKTGMSLTHDMIMFWCNMKLHLLQLEVVGMCRTD